MSYVLDELCVHCKGIFYSNSWTACWRCSYTLFVVTCDVCFFI